jgi:signal transduction histidine kinase
MAGTEGKVAFGYSGIRAMQSTPLISRSGRLVGMISTHWRRPHRPSERELRLLDVLARQAADLIERTQTMDRLTELDRIKTEFISNISHELCTPLASVLGYIELLDSGMAGELTPTQKELLEIAYESGCSLQVLIEELLDVSRMESGRFRLALEAVNLAEMAERALIRVAPQAEAKHLTITRHLSPDVPLLLADARRMQQVFSNLLGNAIKFTSEGGRVDLWVGSQNGSVVVEVADTGPGIHPDDLPRLFDRFHRGRGTGCVPGTGLGLYLIKTIVESHGGTVEVESELGAGSRFRVRLPVR